MKGRKPSKRRLRKAFTIAAASLTLGTAGLALHNTKTNSAPAPQTTQASAFNTVSVFRPVQTERAATNITFNDPDASSASRQLFDAARAGDPNTVLQIINEKTPVMVTTPGNNDFYAYSDPGYPYTGNPYDHDGFYSDFPSQQIVYVAAADVTASNSAALRIAVAQGNTAVAQILLDAGADANALNGAPLIAAVQNDDIAMAQLLLKKGADAGLSTGIVFDIAAAHGNQTMLGILGGKTVLFPGGDPGTFQPNFPME